MTSPACQDSGPFREWAPLTTLLQKIPAKIQYGLFTQDINFTSIDGIAEFIAIGTNHGIIYWFNRNSGELETLKCENTNSSITCIKIVSTVDYMIAAGNNQGVVIIFQIPKQIPDSLPESLKPKKKKQVERFIIRGLHKVPVTTVEWSKNGMKLFSGDQNGLVVLTEIDFYMHLSKSTELLNEKYSVVQLSYQSGLLLISTLFRTIIVNRNQNSQVTQVGHKERKMLGTYGAVFSKNKNRVQEPIIYATRPGLRIWHADKSGIVLKTLMLKDAVKKVTTKVELLNPASDYSRRKNSADPTFGIILPLSDELLVTYNEDVVYIVNPNAIMITSVISDLRKVTDIACSDDEIFILEGERNILRIASYPEIDNLNTVSEEPMNQLPIAESSKSVSRGFIELTSKLKLSPIIPAVPFHKINPTNLIQLTSVLPPVVIGIDTTSIIKAEEAEEVPPIIPLKLDTHLVTEIDKLKKQTTNDTDDEGNSVDRKNIFQKIGEQDFEEVVFTPKRREKRLIDKKKRGNSFPPKKSTDKDFILESEKNLESIQKAVQEKEKLLSNYLSLDLSIYMDKSQLYSTKSKSCSFDSNDGQMNSFIQSWTADTTQNSQHIQSIEQESEEETPDTKPIKLNALAECSKMNSEIKETDHKSCDNKIDSDVSKVSELDFNVMSKEFVKSTIYQDNDDWILLG